MGYETTFRLKGKLDDNFKPRWRERPYTCDIEKGKNVLLATCVLSDASDADSAKLNKLYDKVSVAFKIYRSYLVEDWKWCTQNHLEKNNNEIYFCGWEHADNNNPTWENEDELDNFFIPRLFLLAAFPCSSPYMENDKDNTYSNKIERLLEYINDIEDCVNSMMDYQFINRYRDSEDADESDGYNHRFPEEADDTENEKRDE